MKKTKSGDLKLLWERASKVQKISSISTPKSPTAETQIQNTPPIELHLQVYNHNEAAEHGDGEAVPSFESVEDEDGGAGPSSEGVEELDEDEGINPETCSPLSPIMENSESDEFDDDDESDDGEIYDFDLLQHDPGMRVPIKDYDVDERNAVRRGYIALGSCQPRNHSFPQTNIGGMRRFSARWFDEFSWLEYSVAKDAAFCYVCYLFKEETCAGGDAFVNEGFRAWNTKARLKRHVGGIDSAHNTAQEKFNNFIRPRASIKERLSSISSEEKLKYKARLTYSLKCLRFILGQGLAFRGHDESEESLNQGNFRELLKWLSDNFEEVNKVVLKNAPKNAKMTSPKIQKDIINSCAKETTSLILQELGDECFSILADESSDVYHNEQLAVCLRYVDKKGRVVERFLGVVHVDNTAASTLKSAIQSLLMDNSLTFSRVRGQGYDGASNMKGHISGLKKLIMDEAPSAYYVHCFAHQLQLTLVAVAKENQACISFFEQIRFLLSVIGNSCKKIQMLRVAQAQQVLQALDLGEIKTGQGLNQEMGLGRPCDTRWGSHYKTVMHVILLYPTIRNVLIMVGDDHSQDAEAVNAQTMLVYLESFEFVFMAHLMLTIFGYTNDLNNALQRRDQNIVNAVDLIFLTKAELGALRDDDGWKKFLEEVTTFCMKHDVEVPGMDDQYEPVIKSKRYKRRINNLHRFRVEIFLSVIDRQLRELNDRFDETNTELLICMGSFNPSNSFAAFDKEHLLKLAHFYPMDFSSTDLVSLKYQLTIFINDMRKDKRFRKVKDLGELSIMLVKTDKSRLYPFVYKLLKLVLVLPVATASVERVFSAMNYVKNKPRNRMGDILLNDCMVTFIERDVFKQVKDEAVISRFQSMKERIVKLY